MALRPLKTVAEHTPGLKRLPIGKVIAVAEIAMLTRDHVQRLTPQERRRVLELVRIGRGRPRNLSGAEREELSRLVAKLEPRHLAGRTVDAISPVPLPRRFVYGRSS